MNNNKWFLEVVQDFDGTYYANMILDGNRVNGLPEYVNYNTLRDAIREKTGIEILKKKDMKFQQRGRKKYAYIDATQVREDCRVTLVELDHGWRPKFDTTPVPVSVFIYPQASHACNLDVPCILVGNVIGRKPELIVEGCPSKATISVHITDEVYLDGSHKRVDRISDYYDSAFLYADSLDAAKEKAAEVYKKIEQIKSFPQIKTPGGSYGFDYFEVINLKALSDQQLVLAQDLAKEFVGPQSLAVSRINSEIEHRFISQTKKPLSEQIQSASFYATGAHLSSDAIIEEMETDR